MGNFDEVLRKLRETYKPGTKVRLEKMDDVQAPPIGTIGIVTGVDDIATIHIKWQNGSGLGVAFGEDKVSIISDPDDNSEETL